MVEAARLAESLHELQQQYRVLEEKACKYKLQIAALQEELDDQKAEIIVLNGILGLTRK